jgi:hypothetical protein
MKRIIPIAMLAAAMAVGAAPVASADDQWFTSPSGNISCMLDDGLVRCDINDRSWSPPPRPADCSTQTGYGQGINLHPTGPATFVCGGDTTFGSGATVLQYGQYEAGGGMSCNSEPSGMRCSNSEGRGFTLSRQAYSLF